MSTTSRASLRFPGGALLFFISALLLLALSTRELCDSDTWWHLKTGEIIAAGHIPRADPFSDANAGRSWVNFEWLSQLCLYLIYRLAGPPGLVLGSALIIGLAFLAFSLVGLELRKPLLGSALLTLSIIAASERYLARPEIFSYLFLGAFLLVLHRYRQGKITRLLFLLPPLQVLWENLHGGTWLGLETVGAYAVGQSLLRWFPWPPGWKKPKMDSPRYRRLLLVLALVVAASLINPWGPKTLFTIFKTQAHQFTMTNIAEWQRTYELASPWPPAVWAYWVWVALASLGFVLNFRRLDLNHLFLGLGFLLISLLALRNIALFALVALPITARNFSLAAEDWRFRGRLETIPAGKIFPAARLAAMAFVALFCLGFTGRVITDRYYLDQRTRVRFGWGVSSVVYPCPMLEFLEKSPLAGPIFNDHDLGGFLIWRLWPRFHPFLDSRAVLYDPDYLAAYSRALQSAPDWKALADRHQFRAAALLHGSGGLGPLLRILAQDPDWAPVYLDESGVVFARRIPENADWIAGRRLDLRRPESLTFSAPPLAGPRSRLGFFTTVADPVQVMSAALFFLNAGQPDPAEPLLKQALAIAPGEAAAMSNLAALELKRGRSAEAETWARRAIARDPRLFEAYSHLGDAFYQQGRFAESVWAYGQALNLNPDHYHSVQNRGTALAQLGRYPEAAADLERALSLDPAQPRPWCNLAYIYERMASPRAPATWRQCLAGLIGSGGSPAEIKQVRTRLGEESP